MIRILGIFLACGLGWGQSTADGLYKDALAARRNGDWKKAEFLYRQIRLEAPSDTRWEVGLVDALVAQNKVQDALKLERELVDENPKSRLRHTELGSLLVRINRPEEALEEFQTALRYSPDPWDQILLYSQIGGTYQMLGKLEESIAALRKVREINGIPNMMLVRVLIEHGDRQAAIAECRAMLEKTPGAPGVQSELAYHLAELDDSLDEALTLARRAANYLSEAADAVHTLGWVYFKKGSVVEAEETMLPAMRLEGGTSLVHRAHLAAVMDARNQWTPERRELRRLLDGELSAGQMARLKELLRK